MKIWIIKRKNAKLIVDGTLKFDCWLGNRYGPIQIRLEPDSTLHIKGDFTIGQGVTIAVQTGAILEIGGSSVIQSGITCDTKILVLKRVVIGKDFGCSWNCFITDSDWHGVEHAGKPSPSQSDVVIGDRVWICPDCSILKGSVIGNDSIIGTKSMLRGKTFPPNSLIAGIPAKAVEGNVKWHGDLPPITQNNLNMDNSVLEKPSVASSA
jgi:acetyltransferase-like isoleucine patch superfamily enzyme